MARIRGGQYLKALGLAFALAGTTPAQAAIYETTAGWEAEPSLESLLAKIGIDPLSAGLAEGRDAIWRQNEKATATLAFEFSTNARQNSFGIYDINDPTRRIELFSGHDRANSSARIWFVPDTDGGYSVRVRGGTSREPEVFPGTQFGFYLSNSKRDGQTYFSDTRLNGDGLDHLQAYFHEGAGSPNKHKKRSGSFGPGYILAWEDAFGGGDRDYQDMIVAIHSVTPVPLPPALGMALAGLAVFGLTGWRRRREI